MSDEASKQKILDYVIRNAPIGETAEVIAELKKLVVDYSQYEDFIASLLVKHAQEHFALATGHPSQKTFLLSPTNYNEEQHFYIDQKNHLKVFVNHATLAITKTEELSDHGVDASKELLVYQTLLQEGIAQYLKEYYAGTASGFYVSVEGDSSENASIYIALTCKNLNLSNFHGGEWISEWQINASSLTGKVRVSSHYFEDGNVSLKEVKKVEDSLSLTLQDAVKEAKLIVKHITAHEQNIHTSLEEIYDKMSDSFFKHMRRLLPVTNQKMNWDQSVHKLIANLKQ